uniref:Uncharacterized protein n=1 Tax=Anguilla anguilla TaxID=7936 RepID=A0A0E9RNB5_ANGAN
MLLFNTPPCLKGNTLCVTFSTVCVKMCPLVTHELYIYNTNVVTLTQNVLKVTQT